MNVTILTRSDSPASFPHIKHSAIAKCIILSWQSFPFIMSLFNTGFTNTHTHIWLAALLKMYIWHELSWFVCYISLCTAFVKSRCVKHSNATVLSVRNTTIIEYDVFYIKAFIVFGLCQKVYATGAFNAMMPQLFHSLQFYLLIKCTLSYDL